MHQPVCPAEQGSGKNKIENLVVAETRRAQRTHVLVAGLRRTLRQLDREIQDCLVARRKIGVGP